MPLLSLLILRLHGLTRISMQAVAVFVEPQICGTIKSSAVDERQELSTEA